MGSTRKKALDDTSSFPPSREGEISPDLLLAETAEPDRHQLEMHAEEAPRGKRRDELVEAGQRIGSYRIEQKIGSGSMGRVYAATHLRLGRKVAFKVLRSRYIFNAEALRRFFAEARIAAQINHPNIVSIIDFFDAEGEPVCYVMDLLEGETLRARLKQEEPLTLDQVVEIAEQMARGLQALHGAGVVHRDVKPSNVFLLDADNRIHVKLVDFGLVKEGVRRRESGSGIQEHGERALMGTPAYMPPEQAGAASHVDARADIYAFGTVFYEMLCGRWPFEGTDEETLLENKLTKEPTPITSKYELPTELEELVLRCLASNAEQRPESMGVVLHELEQIREDHLIPQRAAPRLRRTYLLLALLAAAILGATTQWLAKGDVQPSGKTAAPARRAIAKLDSFHQDVSRRHGMDTRWKKAAAKMPLFHLDTLRTGAGSRATVAFITSEKMRVSESSEVLIELPRKDAKGKGRSQVVRLQQGKLHFEVSKATSLLLIDRQGRVTRLRAHGEAALRAKTLPNGKTEVALLAGRAQISRGGKILELKKGEVVEIAGKTLSDAEQLPAFPQLLSPEIDQRLQGDELSFSWKATGANLRYRFQVGREIAFNRVVIDREIERPSVVVERLPVGSYAWRVCTIDERGREGEFGYARRFYLAARAEVTLGGALLSPRDRATVLVDKKPKRIVFRWQTKAKELLFVIARQPDLKTSRVLTRKLKGRRSLGISSARLGTGTLYWGLFATTGDALQPLQQAGRRLTLGKYRAPKIKVKAGGWD